MSSVLNAVHSTNELAWKLIFRKPTSHPSFSVAPLKEDVLYVYEVALTKELYDQPVPDREIVRTDKPYGGHREPFKLLEATRHTSQIYSYQLHALAPFDEAMVLQQKFSSVSEKKV